MLYEDFINSVDTSSRLSGVIPPSAAKKPRVKTLRMQRPQEESAPMPIIFGLLFEVHSGPADGVSSSQRGEGPGAAPLTPPTLLSGAARFQNVDFMLHLCPSSFWVFIWEINMWGGETSGGANLWWGERKENKKISLAVWRSGSWWDSFSRTPGRPHRWSNTFLSPKNHTVKSFKCAICFI